MIDAHQHLWQIGRNDCAWPGADLPAIYRDFSIEDLIPLATAQGVTGSVLVQSQPSDADTDYLLALADQTNFVKAVVGWVDLAAANAPERIAFLAKNKKLRSLRPMLQNLPEDDWILRPELQPALAAMQAHSLCFDALVFTRHLPYLYQFAKTYPGLPIVIDHGAKPPIATEDNSATLAWKNAITLLAELPQVHCKISGLLTEAGAQQGLAALRPFVEHLYASFGAQRLMWGSDWPVLNISANAELGNYQHWFIIARQLVMQISDEDMNKVDNIFAKTVGRFYGF